MWTDTEVIKSGEANVSKYVFTKGDAVAEAVLYRYPDYRTRTVICCSTMSGCPVGCRFCGAGDHFVRALTGEEIIFQVERCLADTGVNPDEMDRLQIMFMSMGEPMLNPRGLEEAIRGLYRLHPNAALLVSTMGPAVQYVWFHKLSIDIPTVGLQFSIHETDEELRNSLIPFGKKLTLGEIAGTGDGWNALTGGRRPFFNYCAADHNTADENADRLAELFNPDVWCATVSVICERNEGMPARNEHQIELARAFSGKLIERGFDVRVFDPAGQDDIGGGCGQLHYDQRWFAENLDKARPSIGNGLPMVHTPTLGGSKA